MSTKQRELAAQAELFRLGFLTCRVVEALQGPGMLDSEAKRAFRSAADWLDDAACGLNYVARSGRARRPREVARRTLTPQSVLRGAQALQVYFRIHGTPSLDKNLGGGLLGIARFLRTSAELSRVLRSSYRPRVIAFFEATSTFALERLSSPHIDTSSPYDHILQQVSPTHSRSVA